MDTVDRFSVPPSDGYRRLGGDETIDEEPVGEDGTENVMTERDKTGDAERSASVEPSSDDTSAAGSDQAGDATEAVPWERLPTDGGADGRQDEGAQPGPVDIESVERILPEEERAGPAEPTDPTPDTQSPGPSAEPDRTRVAPGLVVDDQGTATVQALDSREAVLETAVAIDRHEAIDIERKPKLLRDLVERATVEVAIPAVKAAIRAGQPGEGPDDPVAPAETDDVAGGPSEAGVDSEPGTEVLSSADTVSDHDFEIAVRGDSIETPVGTVATQGDLANVAVTIYESTDRSLQEKAALVEHLAARAGEVGISVTAEQLFTMLASRLDHDPRPESVASDAQAPSSDAQTPSSDAASTASAWRPGMEPPTTEEELYDAAAAIAQLDADKDTRVQRILTLVKRAREQGLDVSAEEVYREARARVGLEE